MYSLFVALITLNLKFKYYNSSTINIINNDNNNNNTIINLQYKILYFILIRVK